jgi:hypothetical protein
LIVPGPETFLTTEVPVSVFVISRTTCPWMIVRTGFPSASDQVMVCSLFVTTWNETGKGQAPEGMDRSSVGMG